MSGNEQRSGTEGGRQLRPCDYPRLDPVRRAYLIFELISTNKPTVFVAKKFGISERQVYRYARRLRQECQRKQILIDLIYYDKDGNLKEWQP